MLAVGVYLIELFVHLGSGFENAEQIVIVAFCGLLAPPIVFFILLLFSHKFSSFVF
jgi:hypothetical protein